MRESIHDLRERDADQSLQNLLRALLAHLELRSRYRVYEFEAAHDGTLDIAELFHEMRLREAELIGELMDGLRSRLDKEEVAHSQGSG